MFFHRRSTQAEFFDRPGLAESETAAAFRGLDRLNRVFQVGQPFAWNLPRWLGPERCRQLEILDIGAGTGLLGRKLSAWAARRSWRWRFTNLDSNPLALKAGAALRPVTASALALPFADNTFDLVVASQMTHHLTDAEVLPHLCEAWRVTRDALFICDLHRNAALYTLLWLTTRLLSRSKQVHDDALISVKRGFHLDELRQAAHQAGLAHPRVWLYHAARIVLQARKGGASSLP